MNQQGRNTLIFMAGISLAVGLYEAWQFVRPFFIDMCNAGFGGCQ